MRRAVVLVIGAVVAAVMSASMVLGSAAPASADTTVVVRGFAFPDAYNSLAIVGCAGLYDRVPEPIPTFLSRGDGAPAGERSLKYDLAGGNAVGSQHRVASLAATTVAGLSLAAPSGTTGVAYVGYQPPADRDSDRIWVGRAELSAAPGGWRPIDVTGLTYTWSHVDAVTHAPVPPRATDLPAPGSATVTDFMATQGGDGQGFYAIGFGCDGNPFKIDALRIGGPAGVTTYDLEGYTSVTDIAASGPSVVVGDAVRLDGTLLSGSGAPVPEGLLVLEAQPFGAKAFSPVEGSEVRGGHASLTVQPTTRTLYRWRFLGSSSTDASTSAPVVVDVTPLVTADRLADRDGGVVVTGTMTPAKAGVVATLWRLTAKRPVQVGSARTDADGRYAIPVADTLGGTWRYVVTVPATAGNLAATSPALSIGPPPGSPTTSAPSPTDTTR